MPPFSFERCLRFLQNEYSKFRAQSPTNQELIQEQNEEIRHHLKSKTTLREMYIDLTFYDQQIRAPKQASKQMALRYRNTLLHLIHDREQKGETMEPDPRMKELAQVKQPQELKQIFCSWIPADKKNGPFHTKWTAMEWNHRKTWSTNAMKDMQNVFTEQKWRDGEDFHRLFLFMEAILFVSQKET